MTAFRFEGNTVFTDAQLSAAVADLLRKRSLTAEDLEEVRHRLTLLYVNNGYINSGAVLPDQDIKDGTVLYRIIEGKLSKVELQGEQRLRRSFILGRTWRDGHEPLNIVTLKNNLELLRLNPNIAAVNAELKPGIQPGESRLDLTVTENKPWQVGLEFDNKRSPSVGAERLSLLASHTNVTGNGDAVALRWGLTKNDLDNLEWSGTEDVTVDYAIPLNARDTTLQFSFINSNEPVVQEPFAGLGVNSRTESYGLTLRHPFYRTPDTEFAMSMTLAKRYNKTFVADVPFSFSPGVDSGESNVSVLRLTQEFSTRGQDQSLTFRSTFSIGLDAFGATVHSHSEPDGQFFSWLGQAQYVRRVATSELVLRVAAQLTDEQLLPLEQISIGGFDTVRGYRENQLVRDNAVIASAELRIPLIEKEGQGILFVAPFVDAGYGWNAPGATQVEIGTDAQFIASAGVGLLYSPSRQVSARLYWGYPFKHFDNPGHDLQDDGIHFDLVLLAF